MITLKEALKEDRQWPRHLRIEHAKYMIRSGPPEQADIWKQVLQANTDNSYKERSPSERRNKPGKKH